MHFLKINCTSQADQTQLTVSHEISIISYCEWVYSFSNVRQFVPLCQARDMV